MSNQFIYKGHSYLELTNEALATPIPAAAKTELAWPDDLDENGDPVFGTGNDWPTWDEMIHHNYPEDGIMAGPERHALDNSKILFKLQWIPLFDQTYRALVNADTPVSGIAWKAWKEAKVIADGPDYANVEI